MKGINNKFSEGWTILVELGCKRKYKQLIVALSMRKTQSRPLIFWYIICH